MKNETTDINGVSISFPVEDPIHLSGNETTMPAAFTANHSDFVADALQKVEKHYLVAQGREWLPRLFSVYHDLPGLLIDAVAPLRKAFGNDLPLQLRALSDGEDLLLTATVSWPGDAETARSARNKFDRHWWLDNCVRAQASLVFDYELVDAL